VRTNPKAISFS